METAVPSLLFSRLEVFHAAIAFLPARKNWSKNSVAKCQSEDLCLATGGPAQQLYASDTVVNFYDDIGHEIEIYTMWNVGLRFTLSWRHNSLT